MSKITSIANIQNMLNRWRVLGSTRLCSGVELVAAIPDAEQEAWMHAVFPGMTAESISTVARLIDKPLPETLQGFYKRCGGMSLFSGLFTVYGQPSIGFVGGDYALRPEDLVAFNHQLEARPWSQPEMVAFARNAWDNSIYVAGIGSTKDEVLRCSQEDGRVLERHCDIYDCVEARMYRLDSLAM